MNWLTYAFLAALAAALVGVFSKIGIKEADPAVATAIRGITIAVFMLGMALWLGKLGGIGELSGRTLFFLILTGIAGGLSWLWGFMALKAGGDATAVNAIDRTSIIFLVIFAALFLSEAFTWTKAAGALLVAMGAFLLTVPFEKIRTLLTFVHK